MKTQLLVIEDELSIRENVAELLTLQGFMVDTAADGHEGINRAIQSQPDLILCDVMMPGMNGYQVLESIRAHRSLSHVPFIFLTARAEPDDLRQGMVSGADDYLIKPFTSKDLLKSIETRLKREQIRNNQLQVQLTDYLTNLGRVTIHEHNTPLAGIMGFIGLLKEDHPTLDSSEMESMLDQMMRCCLRLKRTLENERLTNLLIHPHGSAEYDALSQGNSYVFDALVKRLKQTIEKEHEQPATILIATEMAHLRVPPHSLTKILEELIDNAIKFSERGREVCVSGLISEEYYQLTITNWGRAFKSSDILRIAPYTQFDRNYYEQQGSGLGLFIVKTLIEMNQGHLQIDSKPEGLTKVTLQLSLMDRVLSLNKSA
ncbi:hybrid sensor histidine kinase/response regulator [Spirosoma endophyticum]|uniref:histidine kinase n=1 Tax=Spirosoma endophyticum TaxID=662367 RepID=A0A1I2G9I2_9BACT|nr:response regulator [Spirosoma endophyticum]SFF13819.1 DNA-binding response regulator, OmpR family, contains REC and winged-helix (wHTH) domain [Spirosoma endophyticum]